MTSEMLFGRNILKMFWAAKISHQNVFKVSRTKRATYHKHKKETVIICCQIMRTDKLERVTTGKICGTER